MSADRQDETAADGGGAQSVDRALMLLSLIGRSCEDGASLAAIVSASGLNRATARRLVLALMRSRLVEQHAVSRRYFLGEEAYVLGVFASRRYGFLDCAMESLARLSRVTGDTSFASIRRGDFSVCLHREEGAFPIRTHALMPGQRHPLGIGAGGMAILAALGDDEIDRVIEANAQSLAEDFPAYTPDVIAQDVANARLSGCAVNPGRVLENSWAVGMAVRYPDGGVAGALSIAAIDSRMGEARRAELAGHLRAETAKVEDRLKTRFRARPPGRAPSDEPKDGAGPARLLATEGMDP
ncbi:IclR family transcriptional regulator [Fulvimarina sp. MAC3]|uniref:IclR family transcriptional regulator n=1 Tax=Fulvimarina sp. MAC3 TaxID=3148887 RepID=UPI0031FCC322